VPSPYCGLMVEHTCAGAGSSQPRSPRRRAAHHPSARTGTRCDVSCVIPCRRGPSRAPCWRSSWNRVSRPEHLLSVVTSGHAPYAPCARTCDARRSICYTVPAGTRRPSERRAPAAAAAGFARQCRARPPAASTQPPRESPRARRSATAR